MYYHYIILNTWIGRMENEENKIKCYQSPHEKLTEDQIKSLLEEIQQNHEFLMEYMELYFSIFENDFKLLLKHYFPEKFSISEVPISTMSEMIEKAYGNMSFKNHGETRTLYRTPEDENEKLD